MLSLKFILKSGEGKKNRVKIISVSILLLFLFQAIMMVNVSNNNTINSEENLNNDLNIPIEELPITPEIETIEIEEISDNDITIDIENEEANVPEIVQKNSIFSKINSFQGSEIEDQIWASESFRIENTLNDLSIQNSFDDTLSLQSSTPIDLPVGYTNTDQSILIDNITALYNYEYIEFENSNYNWLDSIYWQSVATSFEVTEARINLTQVRLAYLKSDIGSLAGEAYITQVVNGKPEYIKMDGQTVDLTSTAGTNATLAFTQPITLTAGTYAVVLNQTSFSSESNFFHYKYVNDDGSGDSNNETKMWQKLWGGSWISFSRDLFFSYEYISLDASDSSKIKEYSGPNEVQLNYDINGNSLEFTSSSSINFDFFYSFEYKSIDRITISVDFMIDNNTLPSWEGNFVHSSSPSGEYIVNSRKITISDIPLDWNSTDINQNSNIYSSDPDNDLNLLYNNGTSTLTILLNEDTNSHSWTIYFKSPNYINSLTLKQKDLTVLNSPYKITSPDTLRIIANMDTSDLDSNGSLFVFDPSDLVNHYETNVLISSNVLTYNIWDPSETLNLNEDNSGIYSIVTYWIDSSLTKIGFFETIFELMIQTELSAFSDSSTYSASEIIHLTADFSSTLNGTILDTADITYTTSWDASTGVLTQSQSHGSYTADISAVNAPIGPTSITVYASLEGYESKSVVVPITITQEETSLDYSVNGTIASSFDLKYKETISLSIFYTLLNGPILSATVEVNSTLATEESDGSYTFLFDTSNIFPYMSSFTLIINASKTSYLSKDLIITFNMDEASTKINPQGNTPVNNSLVTKYFSHSSLDLIELQLQYQESIHGKSIKNALITHNASATDFSISLSEDFNNGWTIQLNPETIGNFAIIFMFDMLGYQQLTYVLSIQVDITPTSIIQNGNPDFNGIDSTISVTYDPNSYSPLVLFVTYYDVIYNDILDDGLLEASSDGINVSIVINQFENGTYIIQLDPQGSGIENITISYDRINYLSSLVSLTLEIEEIIGEEEEEDKFCEFIVKKGNKKHKIKIKKKLCRILKKIFDRFKSHKWSERNSDEHHKYYFSELSRAIRYAHDTINQCMKHKNL